MNAQIRFEEILREEFKNRKQKNPSYSMRAFANFLEVDQSTLSKFFKRDRDLSWKIIEKCAKKLNLSAENLQAIKKGKQFNIKYVDLEDSMLTMLSSWSYWAILEYFKVNPSADAKEISTRLGLKLTAVKKAIILLKNLGFIEEGDGVVRLLKPNNAWNLSPKTTKARKKLQEDFLLKSLDALKKVPLEHRLHGSLTVAVDSDQISAIKDYINKFQSGLGNFCQKKGRFNNVYQMQISFYPLSKVGE